MCPAGVSGKRWAGKKGKGGEGVKLIY